jgi:predicted metal-dependent hydrolase
MINLDLFDQLADLLKPESMRRSAEQVAPKTPRASSPKSGRERPRDANESRESVALAGHRVDYKLVRRRGRRGVGLKIDGSGLTVAASLTTPISAIEGMIAQHEKWVAKKLGEWSSRRIVPQSWETGALVPFLGESLTLMTETGRAKTEVTRALNHLFVKVRTPDGVEKAVVQWMKREALPLFAQRAFHFARLHQLAPPEVMLSSANGRWGSCNSRREVRFSWRLVKAPPALIDYVVCHELAHLRHMNHSSAFWAEVARMCPDYLARKRELDQHDHRFRAF